jgi:endogenous inhibitor of DNA gyrase (YacG/DUF329 family)
MKHTLKIVACPTCGSERIKLVCRAWKGKTGNISFSIPSLSYYECPECNEKVYPKEAMRKIEDFSPVFKNRRRINKIAA